MLLLSAYVSSVEWCSRNAVHALVTFDIAHRICSSMLNDCQALRINLHVDAKPALASTFFFSCYRRGFSVYTHVKLKGTGGKSSM